MTWRPPGWIKEISFEEISHIEPCLVSMMTEREIKIFEAGADAMLEGLKKAPRALEIDLPMTKGEAIKGVVVFIPDNEE